MINFCGIAGVLFAFVGLVLIAVSGSLPNFVDIFLIQFESQLDDSEAIGGIGVFTSFYDPTTQDPAVIAASGVPDEEINADTLEFPLLFPAEFNFVEDILPVNAELAGALQVVTDNAVDAQEIIALIDPILALDAEELGCATYATELDSTVSALTDELHDPVVFPSVLTAVGDGIGVVFTDSITAAQFLLAGDPTNEDQNNLVFNVVDGALSSILEAFPATPGCEAVDADSDITDPSAALTCLQGGFTGAADQAAAAGLTVTEELLDGVVSALLPVCAAAGVNVTVCFADTPGYILDDVAYVAAATFGANTPTACELFPTSCVQGTTNKFLYLALLLDLTTETIAGVEAQIAANEDDLVGLVLQATLDALEDLFGAVGLTLVFLNRALVLGLDVPGFDATQNTVANIVLVTNAVAALDYAAVATFDTAYPPCLLLQVAAGGLGALGDVDGTGDDCTVSEFFVATNAALQALENENADLFSLIAGLYAICEEGTAALGSVLVGCPTVFTNVIISGGFAGSVDAASADIVADAEQECEDDIVDSEKVAQAQASLITSFVFYGLNVIVSPFAFLVRSYAPLVYGFSAASALFAGLATLTALLIVRSAPVYQGVGEGINEDIDENDAAAAADAPFEIFFTEGVVALIAFLDTILMFVTSGCFIGAVVIECMCQDDDFDEEEEDEKKDEDVGSPAAAAEDDYKVVAANGEEVGI